jgi:hypothetical protein
MTNKEQMQRLKFLVDREAITRYREIFEYIPKTIYATEMHQSYKAVVLRGDYPAFVTFSEILKLSDATGIDPYKLSKLVLDDILYKPPTIYNKV